MFPFFADRDMGHERFEEVQQAIQTTTNSVHKHLTGSQYQLHAAALWTTALIHIAFTVYTLEGVKSQIDNQTALNNVLWAELKEQAMAIKDEQAKLIVDGQTTLTEELQRELKQHSATMRDEQAALVKELQAELKGQAYVLKEERESLRQSQGAEVVINGLQEELKEHTLLIKQQAAMMEELQAAMRTQTEMVIEQQRLLKETWWGHECAGEQLIDV